MPTFLGRRVPTSAIIAQAPRPYTAPAAGAPAARGAAPTGDLAQAISGLGGIFSNGTARALQQEQLTALGDKNELTRMVAGSIGADGEITDSGNFARAAALGAADPGKQAAALAQVVARSGGVDSPRLAEILTADGKYKQTPLYGDREFANAVARQGMMEASKIKVAGIEADNRRTINDDAIETYIDPATGKPVMGRRRDAPGMAPVLSVDQNKALRQNELWSSIPLARQQDSVFGAQATPDVYNATTEDGRTVPATVGPGGAIFDLNTKQPLAGVRTMGKLNATSADGLGSADKIGEQVLAGRISTERAVGLIDGLKVELDKPNSGVSVGFLGSLSEVANNIRSQVESGAKAIGGLSAKDELRGNDPQATEVKGAVDRVMQENQAKFAALQQQGIDTARIRALIEDLAYAQAKANDPSGRVSNQDVERAGRQVGMGLGDPVAMKEVLADLRERTISGQEIRERNSSAFLKNGQTIPAWNSPIMQGRPGRPAQAAPAAGGAAPPAAGGEETWVRGPDGKLKRAQ